MLERKLAISFIDKDENRQRETLVECFLSHAGLDIQAGWSTIVVGYKDLLAYIEKSDNQLASSSRGFCRIDDNSTFCPGDYLLTLGCFKGVFPSLEFERLKQEIDAFKGNFFDPFDQN